MCQTLNGIDGKLMVMTHSIISGLVVKCIPPEMIDMLCDDSTGFEEADFDDRFATEADTIIMIYVLYEYYFDEIQFREHLINCLI